MRADRLELCYNKYIESEHRQIARRKSKAILQSEFEVLKGSPGKAEAMAITALYHLLLKTEHALARSATALLRILQNVPTAPAEESRRRWLNVSAFKCCTYALDGVR